MRSDYEYWLGGIGGIGVLAILERPWWQVAIGWTLAALLCQAAKWAWRRQQ